MTAEHRHFADIPSTNLFLKQWASKSDPQHGTMVTADYQSQGVGQYGRKWSAAAGQNLLMSILLKPKNLATQEITWLTISSALAICSVLKELTIDQIQLKWPNDLYAQNRKLAGILTESAIQKNTVQYVVIGIGLNVHQQVWLEEMDINPITLEELTEQNLEISRLYAPLREAILQFSTLAREDLVQQYNQLLYGRSELWTFSIENQDHSAILSHLDMEGNLHFITPAGQKWYTAGWHVQNLRKAI